MFNRLWRWCENIMLLPLINQIRSDFNRNMTPSVHSLSNEPYCTFNFYHPTYWANIFIFIWMPSTTFPIKVWDWTWYGTLLLSGYTAKERQYTMPIPERLDWLQRNCHLQSHLKVTWTCPVEGLKWMCVAWCTLVAYHSQWKDMWSWTRELWPNLSVN